MDNFSGSELEVSCPACNKTVSLGEINSHLDTCVAFDNKNQITSGGFNDNQITSGGFNDNKQSTTDNGFFNNTDNFNNINNNDDESSDNNSDKDYWEFGDDDSNKQNNNNNSNKDNFPHYNTDMYSRDYNPGSNNEVSNNKDDSKDDFCPDFDENSNTKFGFNKVENNNNNYSLYNNNNHINYNNDTRPLTIVAIGKTGSGKSTILNRFRGDTSEKGDKGPFKAKGGGKSVTQVVQSSTQQFNFKENELKCYNNILCQLIDTPGLADTCGNEEKLVNEVRHFFKQVCKGVHVFIVTFNVTNVRYDTNIQNLLHLLTELFGEKFWRHVMIVFTRHDAYSNKKIHSEEYEDCMSQYPEKIKKEFNLSFEVCSTGIGKNNYIKAIKDILKFSENRGIFECQYMKSWKEAGGVGNPQQRKQKENQLILAMANQEKKYLDEIKRLESKLKLQLENQKRETEDWKKQLSMQRDSTQLIRQLEMDQDRKNKELELQIRDLQRQSNNSRNNRPGFLSSILGVIEDKTSSSCLVM